MNISKLRNFFNQLLNLRTFVLCNVLVLVAKIGFSVYQKFPGLYFEDGSIAYNIAKYGIYSEFMNIGPTAYKLPVYPLFLACWQWISPEYFKEITVVIQHFLFFVVPFLMIKILQLVGKEKTGIIAAYFFIFSPGYFYYSNVLEVTNVFIPVFIVWVYFYLKIFLNKYQLKDLFLLAVFTAILFLTQVVVVPFAIVLLIGLLFFKKIHFRQFTLLFVVSVFFYSLWVIRNYLLFDKVIVTKTPFWQNIYLSFTPQVNVWKDVVLISNQHEQQTFKQRKTVDEFRMEKIYKQKTLQVLEGNEEAFIKKAVQNAILIWFVPSRYYHDNSLSVVLGRKGFVLLINILSILSLFYIFKTNRLLFCAYVLLFVGFTLPYMIGHAANTRFKLDFEWTQYILVSIFIYEILLKNNVKKKVL